MGISESKKKIVIDNYFKKECDVNTSIKEAFTKGFELGLTKATIPQKMRKFAEWVASEIFDDNWEYNKDAFAEIACRKLEKLGIVRAKGDEWELVEPQESEG